MKKANLLLFFMLFLVGCFLNSGGEKEINDILKSIDKGIKFLKSQLKNEEYFLSCEATDSSDCPVNNQGKIYSLFFVIDSIQDKLTEGEIEKITQTILSKSRNGLWGYSTNSPVDSDDTAFAIRALNKLSKKTKPEKIFIFYKEKEESFVTFLSNTTNPSLEFEQTVLNNDQIHPEVNTNIYSLLQNTGFESYINYDLIKKSQSKEGYWHSYFYPSEYYSTYLSLNILCAPKKFKNSIEKGIEFITNTQNLDGSWGSPGNAYETSLALNSLATCNIFNNQFKKGIVFLQNNQNINGSWQSPNILWQYYHNQEPLVIWKAYDINNIITTSLAVKALKEATK